MFSLLHRRETGVDSPATFFDAARVHKHFVQRLKLDCKLEIHRGCVNTICWNESGHSILSGSDDQNLVISDPYTGKVRATIRSGHHSNIFSARFLPNCHDNDVVSCSGSGSIYYTQVDREDLYGKCLFDCHVGTTYEIVTVPNEPRTFLSCGEDGTVRWFDLRLKTSCNKERCKDDVLINCRSAVTSIAVDPVLPYQLATACADGSVRVFDRRMLATRLSGTYSSRSMTGLVCRFLAPLEHKTYRITSLNYSPCGHDVLASYSAENVYLFNTQVEEGKRLSKSEGETESTGINGTESAGASGVDSAQPPTKRLRLRGDWSDTGPNARPERERGEEGDGQPQANLMQRMSDMLTRWLDGSLRRREDEQQEGAGAVAEASEQERSQEGEGVSSSDHQQGSQSAEGATQGTSSVGEEARESVDGSDHVQGSAADVGCVCDQDAVDVASLPAEQSMLEEATVDTKATESDKDGHSCRCPQDCELKPADCDSGVSVTQALGYGVTVSSEAGCEESQNVPSCSGRVGVGEKARSGTDTTNTAGGAVLADRQAEQLVQQVTQSSAGSVNDRSSTPERLTETKLGAELSLSDPVDSCDSGEHCFHVAERGTALSAESKETDTFRQRCDLDKGENVAEAHHRAGTSQAVPKQENSMSSVADDGMGTIDIVTGEAAASRLVSKGDVGLGAGGVGERDCAREQAKEAPGTTVPTGHLEPVISLHYSDQGTTASTIQVAYASFDVLDSPRGHLAEPGSAPSPPRPAGIAAGSQTFGGARAKQAPSSVVMNPDNESPVPATITNEEGAQQDVSRPMSECEDVNTVSSAPSFRLDTSLVDTKRPAAAVPRRDEGGAESSTAEPASASVSHRLDPQPSTSGSQGALAAETEQSSSSGSRHRRLGHSGPPTGDFQLVLDDENDSDEEGGGPPNPDYCYGPSGQMDRHHAATCMQSMFRKRLEEREQREMATVFQPQAQRMYTGHRNSRTMIKEANFWGESIVMSGSDCGRIFLWDRETTQLMMLLEADRHVVNCLQPHPFDPILASSGIDYDVKVWAPLEAEPCFDVEMAEEVMRRNQIMLEETRDTITVPAAFMLRVLASLNQIRAGRAGAGRQQDSPGDSD